MVVVVPEYSLLHGRSCWCVTRCPCFPCCLADCVHKQSSMHTIIHVVSLVSAASIVSGGMMMMMGSTGQVRTLATFSAHSVTTSCPRAWTGGGQALMAQSRTRRHAAHAGGCVSKHLQGSLPWVTAMHTQVVPAFQHRHWATAHMGSFTTLHTSAVAVGWCFADKALVDCLM
jgi:hypothetical protein